MIYEVKYFFYGVPRDKHYGLRTFDNLSEAFDFAYRLDDCHIECFEVSSKAILHMQCISDKYCPAKSTCKRCKYKREDFDF